DVPDHPAREDPVRLLDRALDERPALAHQGPEALRRDGSDRDLGQRGHAADPISGAGTTLPAPSCSQSSFWEPSRRSPPGWARFPSSSSVSERGAGSPPSGGSPPG